MASLGQQTIFLHAQTQSFRSCFVVQSALRRLTCPCWLLPIMALCHDIFDVYSRGPRTPCRGGTIGGRSLPAGAVDQREEFHKKRPLQQGWSMPGPTPLRPVAAPFSKASAFADRPNMALQPAIKRSSFEDPFPGVENWPICLQGSGVAFQCFLVLRLEMQHSRSQARHFAQQILRRSWNKLTSSRRPSIALPKAEPEKFRGPWTTARCFVEFCSVVLLGCIAYPVPGVTAYAVAPSGA